MRVIKKIFLFIFLAALFLLLGILSINIYMIQFSKPYIYSDFSSLPEKYTVIVPGARVYQNNISYVVRDRLEAASECVNGGNESVFGKSPYKLGASGIFCACKNFLFGDF